MQKRYQITFRSVDDFKAYMREIKQIEFNPPIPTKTLFIHLTEEELTVIKGSYNAEAEIADEE